MFDPPKYARPDSSDAQNAATQIADTPIMDWRGLLPAEMRGTGEANAANISYGQFRIYGGTIARKWWQWREREEWYIISSEGATLGPFASYVEAADALYSAGVRISRP